MYAVIKDRGKQYKVEPGESIQIDLRENVKKGDTLEFEDVLMVSKEVQIIIPNERSQRNAAAMCPFPGITGDTLPIAPAPIQIWIYSSHLS